MIRENGLVQMLSWVDDLLDVPEETRLQLVEVILKDIERFGSIKDQPTPEGKALAKALRSKEYQLVGIMPNIMYIRVKGSKDDLDPIWVHPWGLPALVFKHKKTCALLIAGPGIRWNTMALAEVPANREQFRKMFGAMVDGGTG